MDFSNPANPLGVSRKVKAEIRRYLKYLHRYPDDDAKRLRKIIGRCHSIDPELVLCGNGRTELLYLITKTINPQKVLIPEPTDTAYARSCRIGGAPEIVRLGLRAEDEFGLDPDAFIEAMGGKISRSWEQFPSEDMQEGERRSPHACDMAFLCNPNNPTGRLLPPEAVEKIVDAAEQLGCHLIIDEAHIDFSPGRSMIQVATDRSHVVVLRSMSHAYALAGVRFGYGVFPARWLEQMKSNRPPFMVNILAQQAAAAALKDTSYKKQSQTIMQREKAFLEKSFRKLGLRFFPSDTNFYLLKTTSAGRIWEHLGGKGIIVRRCSDFHGLDDSYIRVAVKSHRENATLVKELSAILASGD